MQQEESNWGLVSPNGYFQPIGALSVSTIEYATKSLEQLEQLLVEHVETEAYEICAVIRDEIYKRTGNNQPDIDVKLFT